MTQDRDEFIDTISQLPGVGEAKAEALWEAGYRSVDEVAASSAEELADEVDGVGSSLAEDILQGIEDLDTDEETEPEEAEESDEPDEEPEAEEELIDTVSQLPGVGEAKAEALWEAGYRSVDEVAASSAEELADEVDGVGPKLADAILQGIEDLEAEPEPEVEIVEEAEEEEAAEEPEEAAEIVEEDEHIPKPKPDLDEATERALKIRKRINDQRPTFVRRNWWQFPRFDKDHSWRKPRGTHSKMREDRQHAPKRVKVGYRGPKEARGLHPSGFEDVLVHNTDDLEELDPDTQAARIASGVGKRKKIKIVEEAQDLGIHVLNPGEVSR